MKTLKRSILAHFALALFPLTGFTQINSGSNGSDGALNPSSNLVINMTDHADGIYHYTSVNIPSGVTVSFQANAENRPVVWLVQGSVSIAGTIQLSGNSPIGGGGAAGGPGGFRGGGTAGGGSPAGDGLGPGGGKGTIPYPGANWSNYGGNASFATIGGQKPPVGGLQAAPGETYGNVFVFPLVGGSGGGGGENSGGCGGGGAILIAAANEIVFAGGSILAQGGQIHASGTSSGGAGSGGSIRLVSQRISGSGFISAAGGRHYYANNNGGDGRVRFDAMDNVFAGGVEGQISRGFQPIIISPANQAVTLAIQSVGGLAVNANPTGTLTTPDIVVPAHQQNPVPIVVRCTNIPLNSEIIVDVKPANGGTVRAIGVNSNGSQASSTATVQMNMPRGGGTIQAKAVSGMAMAAASGQGGKTRSLAETGWTTSGERFSALEVTSVLSGDSRIVYVTESGKRYPSPMH